MYTVQIVDDEPFIRLGLKSMIQWEALGFTIVHEARNGEEALRQLEESSVDLIISDIRMPKKTGIELLEEVKNRGWDIPVVFLTGHSEFGYAQQGLKLGLVEYLLKPLDTNQLKEMLGRVKIIIENKKKNQRAQEEVFIIKNEASKLKQAAEEANRIKTDQQSFFTLFVDEEGMYTQELEKKLIQLVIAGEMESEDVLNQLIGQLMDTGENNYSKVLVRLQYVMSAILHFIKTKYPYLDQILLLDYYESFGGSTHEDTSILVGEFKEKLNGLMVAFKEFKLSDKNQMIYRTCDYVFKNIDSEITLASIAQHLNMSKNYFCTLFKQETGENFLDFVTRIKIERAKYLLKNKNMMVYEVSNYLGYQDTTYFGKLFKKYTNMTPMEYKKIG